MATNPGQPGRPNNYNYGRTAPALRPDEHIGRVVADSARTESTGNSSVMAQDPGLTAHLPRPKAPSDMAAPSPEGHVVALGQRTTDTLGYGQPPAQRPPRPVDSSRLINQNTFEWE